MLINQSDREILNKEIESLLSFIESQEIKPDILSSIVEEIEFIKDLINPTPVNNDIDDIPF